MTSRNQILWICGGLAGTALAVAAIVAMRPPRRVLPPEFAGAIDTPADVLTMLHCEPGGTSLLAGGAAGDVLTVTFPSRQVQQLGKATGDPLTCLVESPDGLILAGAASGHLRAWVRPDLKPVPVNSPKLAVTSAAFVMKQGRRRIVLGLADGRLAISSENGDAVRDTKHRSVKALLVSPDGAALISSGSEGRILWRDSETGKQTGESEVRGTEIASLVLSPDASQVAAGDWNGRLWILDAQNGRRIAAAQQPEAVSGLAWSGTQLVSSGWDGHLRVWNVSGKSLTLDREIDTGRPVHSLAVIPDGPLAATVCGSSAVELWHLPNVR